MAYSSIHRMAESPSLISRVAACAAAEGETNPAEWARQNVWAVVASPGWADAWDYALATETDDDNPDTGARPGVITDAMILSAVQAVRAP